MRRNIIKSLRRNEVAARIYVVSTIKACFPARNAATFPRMFRCDNCLKEKPDGERTRVPGWMALLMGYAGMVNIDAVCHDCAQRTRRLGYLTFAGFLLIFLILAGAVMKAF